jgi:TIR domain
MAYEYDLLLSYKHLEDWNPWVFEIFVPLLKASIETQLGRRIKIFQDVNEISPTETDESKLVAEIARGLGGSRCIVALWSMMYFRSRWCWCESRSFAKRMDQTSAWSPIYPVVLHNGEYFPDFARAIQWLDVREYAIPNMRTLSRVHEGLSETIRKGAGELAPTIERAPQWQPEWLSHDWFYDQPFPENDLSLQVLPKASPGGGAPSRWGLLIANSSSTNAVSFSSARTTKRFPSSRCASAIQIVRPVGINH